MKSTLTFETLRMPGANLGNENPLPDIKNLPDVHSDISFDPSIPKEECKYFNYGRINGILPYRLQDQYDRDKTEKDFGCAVLENDYLKAVFLPQYGGKLWSLFDKVHNRHLLHVNPVFQPANLALRNAWTSGGVEWNIGMTGHTPYTLSQLHTGSFTMSDGTPVLRMYEWERIRQVSYQIDAYLPEDSRYLFVRVRLCNTKNEEVPIYWWSNMAVDETPDTRVLAPADQAFCFDYSRVITKHPVPMYEGVDRSYTTRATRSMDLFFDIKEGQRKWEAALDGKGSGLVQTSTDRLQGRKLFMWGVGSGGKHWQEFLAKPGKAYLEIQAGLANTQMEHLPMPAGAKWEWLEAYGYLEANPKQVHSDSWQEAYACVDAQLEADFPREKMDREAARAASELDTFVPATVYGSGWAALELMRINGSEHFAEEKAGFSKASLGADQAPWVELLKTGVFPDSDPAREPAAYLTQKEWVTLLEESVTAGKTAHWHGYYQLGVMYAASGEMDKARIAFEKSIALTKNGWSERNLAMLDLLDGAKESAADHLVRAFELVPILPVAIECGQALCRAGRFSQYVDFYDALPVELQNGSRLRTLRVEAAIELSEYDLALELLNGDGPEVCDMREGEILLSDLWVKLHMSRIASREGVQEDDALRARVLKEFPIPSKLDFRMKTE